jgi:hypothetical protein
VINTFSRKRNIAKKKPFEEPLPSGYTFSLHTNSFIVIGFDKK